MSCYIIAEAGVNHNGDIDLAYQLIDIAADAKVDAVKFQTAVPELVMVANAKKAVYQCENDPQSESQLEMARRIHLPLDAYKKLKNYTLAKGIDFLSTPFDMTSIETLVELGQTIFKIPSGEITNLPYLRRVAEVSEKVILSTGMSTLDEVAQATSVILEKIKKENFTLLHCTTQYPTPTDSVNLKAMLTLKDKFGVNVGYSDHTLGIDVSIAAVAMGSTVIEKHFTIDKNLEGPDHKASLEPNELRMMVESIRKIEQALGNGAKVVQPAEKENIDVARKSIVANCSIKKGEVFTEENITVKRPGAGLSPMRWDEVIGAVATKNYEKDEFIEL